MITFYIVLQVILFLLMISHDWVPVPPFNDISALKAQDTTFYRLLGSTINGIVVLIPLILTVENLYEFGFIKPRSVRTIFIFYFILTLGTILSWWIPYVFGSSAKHKAAFKKFRNTHHFIPARGDNVTPNTLHVFLHFIIWSCLALTVYFYIH